jgi:hypothetical protein
VENFPDISAGVGIEPRRAHRALKDKVTFPRAPLQSRKVGFPDSGFGLGFSREAFPTRGKLKRSLAYTPTHFGLPLDSSLNHGSSGLRRWPYGDRQVSRAPLPATSVTHGRVASSTTSKGITPSSSLVRAHAPNQLPLPDFVYPHLFPEVLAGCCEPLLGTGSSRRYLCKSFPGCLSH